MLTSIGEELGDIMDMEITISSAKLKVMIDGLQPLVKDTIVEFPDGSEAIVILDYKNLKKHCSYCFRLSHEEKDCPGLIKETRKSTVSSHPAERSKTRETSRNYYTQQDNFKAPSNSGHHPPMRRLSPNRLDYRANNNTSSEGRKDYAYKQSSYTSSLGEHTSRKRKFEERGFRSTPLVSSRYQGHRSPYLRKSPPRREHANSVNRNHQPVANPNMQWRAKSTQRDLTWAESSDTSRIRRPPLERGVTTTASSLQPVPIPTIEEVMGELREVTVQYTNCADPTESLARKQRVLQGEARGLMAETAALIISNAARSHAPSQGAVEEQGTAAPSLSSDLPIHPAEVPPPDST